MGTTCASRACGAAFLLMTKADLIAAPYNMAGGSALKLDAEIQRLKGTGEWHRLPRVVREA